MASPGTETRRLAVAVSGGRDSVALLHAACRSAQATGLEVVALHVNHGLMPDALAWEAALRRRVRQWARAGWPVRLVVDRLTGAPAPAESVEAWARRARYAALAHNARAAGCSLVLLAHHRRDQAETVLLQALRAAGPAGLSAMPRAYGSAGLLWVRPWIDWPPEAIEAYARRHGLRWVDDPSNADPRFDRSRLRQAVWPALQGAFDQAESALARVAAWQQEAQAALEALAAIDGRACREPLDGGSATALRLGPWCSLPSGRRAGVLRAWLGVAAGGAAGGGPADDAATAPGGRLLARLLEELPQARTGARWDLPGPAGERLRLGCLRGGRLVVLGPSPRPDAPGAGAAPAVALGAAEAEPAPAPALHPAEVLAHPGVHRLSGWPGRFEVTAVAAQGLALERLRGAVLRPRSGGERFQSGPGRPARSLKKQFQAAGVPQWGRDGPLLWSAGPAGGAELLWVATLGVDARVQAPPGVPQVRIVWHADAPGRCQAPAGEPR